MKRIMIRVGSGRQVAWISCISQCEFKWGLGGGRGSENHDGAGQRGTVPDANGWARNLVVVAFSMTQWAFN